MKNKLFSHRLPPGSIGFPIVGETLEFIINDPKFVEKRYLRYGPIFKSHIIGRPTIFMIGPEAAEFILSSHMDHFSWREGWPESFKVLLGESLFIQEGAKHKQIRRLIMPAFHGQALTGYIKTMESVTLRYLKKWEQQHEFAWFDEYRELSFDIASRVILGANSASEVAYLSKLFATLVNGMMTITPLHLPWTPFGKAVTARYELIQYLTKVIRHHQENPTKDALSLLMQAKDENGNSMSLEELTNQAILLLFAGHETTTSMLTWLCLELAYHPKILERAREEQFGLAKEGPLDIEQLKQMHYLDQILCEVERLHPPGAGAFRYVIKPFEFNGFYIPDGWIVYYSIFVTHRLAQIYPEPERFDPERFSLEGQKNQQHPFSLIGFGGGPRSCIGKAFSKLEMKIVIAHLLRGYQWKLLHKQHPKDFQIPIRRPQNGLRVSFQPL